MKLKKDKDKDIENMEKMLKQAKELLEQLKEGNIPKPEFKIIMESDKSGEGYSMKVEGNKPSLCLALSELVCHLLEEEALTKEDVMESIEAAFEEVEEE